MNWQGATRQVQEGIVKTALQPIAVKLDLPFGEIYSHYFGQDDEYAESMMRLLDGDSFPLVALALRLLEADEGTPPAYASVSSGIHSMCLPT